MSYYSSPEELAANPPESWRVVKRAERLWHLLIDSSHEHPAETFTTRRAALAERDDPTSRLRRAVEQERRWMAGETPAGWKSHAECMADRARNEAYQAKRQAERVSSNPNYRPEHWP
jgi:hypothetical protein